MEWAWQRECELPLGFAKPFAIGNVLQGDLLTYWHRFGFRRGLPSNLKIIAIRGRSPLGKQLSLRGFVILKQEEWKPLRKLKIRNTIDMIRLNL